MSSGTSTERRPDAASSFQPSHFYIIASMVAATAAVMTSRNTHPMALILLSGAALSAGLIGLALHRSVIAFFSLGRQTTAPPSERTVEMLQREKALVLRSIKELEFDHAMGKVSDADFKDIGGRLRTRALALMQDLERAAHVRDAPAKAGARASSDAACRECGRSNDDDARFCKHCGARL
jgi:hypothetical protein